jgi:hypothetical protein
MSYAEVEGRKMGLKAAAKRSRAECEVVVVEPG